MYSDMQGPGGKGLIVKTVGGKSYETDMAMLVIGESSIYFDQHVM
jgi:hypothetical protein